jgi:hypothetical protein
MTKGILGFVACCMIVLTMMPSCKQGCNDSKAYNYSKEAKQNDGTCLYCDSIKGSYNDSNNVRSLYDNNPTSPHYQQYVMDANSVIYYTQYKGNGCKQIGKGALQDCFFLDHYLKLKNNTNSTIVFDSDLQIYLGTNYRYFYLRNIEIPALGSYKLYLDSYCSTPSGGTSSPYFTSTTFSYK